MQSKQEQIQYILSKKETRLYYLQHDFFVWCIYYFSSSFHYPKFAQFHKDRCKSVQDGRNVYIEGFRESGKTLFIGLLYDIWCIVYRKKRFICAFSYEGTTAKDYLFKIAVQLQTNKKLIDDYGQLFYSENMKEEKQSQKKSIAEFITENDVKLKAFSIGTSMRGQNFMSKDGMVRPDSLIFDDIDVLKSVQNPRIIDDNFRFIEDEVLGGLADYCQIRILGNVIKSDGLNPRLREKSKKLPDRCTFSQPIIENGKITRERFVETDAEASKRNENIQDNKSKVISLESKLNELGQISYNQNYLLIPQRDGERLFKQSYIKMFDEDIKFDYIVMGLDPAFSEKSKSDTFGIVVTGFKKVENVLYKYVIQCVGIKGENKNNENICRQVLNLYLIHKPRTINVEKNNGGEIFAKMFKNPAYMQGYNLPVELITATKDKYSRALEYEGAFQRGEVYFKVGTCTELIDQMLSFTGESGNADDLVDSMIHSFYTAKRNYLFDTM